MVSLAEVDGLAGSRDAALDTEHSDAVSETGIRGTPVATVGGELLNRDSTTAWKALLLVLDAARTNGPTRTERPVGHARGAFDAYDVWDDAVDRVGTGGPPHDERLRELGSGRG